MAGHLKLHPLTKLYDEVRRGRDRTELYVTRYKNDLTKEQQENLWNIVEKLTVIIQLIPEQYHKNTYEIKKMLQSGE